MEPVLTMKNVCAYGPDGRALVPPTDLTVLPRERVRVVTEGPRFEALARIAGGLAEPDVGEVCLAGGAGYVAPEPGFWEGMTVLDNVGLPLLAAGVPKRERRDAAMDALESVSLGYAAHTYPRGLGLCERRLAALARALVTRPALLILSDPSSMLDEKETARLSGALAMRWETAGFAVLYRAGSGRELIPADRTIDL